MIILFTGFLVSFVGLVILLVFKEAELRNGKTYFSPLWLLERDSKIERGTRFALYRTKHMCMWFGRSIWKFVSTFKQSAGLYMKNVRDKRFKKKLDINGDGSVYLKQVIEHRNSVRNGEPSEPSSEF